jgi:hypothetical protein
VVLDKQVQQVIMQRLQELAPEELQALDGIPGPAAEVLLYNILPELDFLLLEKLPALQGHQYQPERVLHGQAMQEAQQGGAGMVQPQQQGLAPQGPAPQGLAPQGPAPQGPQGALGGLR